LKPASSHKLGRKHTQMGITAIICEPVSVAQPDTATALDPAFAKPSRGYGKPIPVPVILRRYWNRFPRQLASPGPDFGPVGRSCR